MSNTQTMPSLQDLHQKAATLYEEKKLKEALEIYEQIITYNPADEVALSVAMDIYLELDDKFNYYLARANVNIAQNKLDYAINDTKKALELDSENIEARRKLARLYKVSDKSMKAIDEFLKLLEVNENEIDCYFELVDLYMKEGIKVAKDEILKIKIMLQDGQNEAAMEALSNVNYDTLNDVQKAAFQILKAQYYYNTNEFEKSLDYTNEYIKIAKPNAVSFQMKALIYEGLNKTFDAHLNWGFCYKYQNKFDEAIVEFDAAYKINPNDKTVLIELANLYEYNKERYVAMEFWQKVYDIDKDEQARQILAEFYYSEGNFEKAAQFGKEIERKEENYTGFLDKIMDFFSKK